MKVISALTAPLDGVVSNVLSKYTHQLYFTKREPAYGDMIVSYNCVRRGRQTLKIP